MVKQKRDKKEKLIILPADAEEYCWVNTKFLMKENLGKEKPCHVLGYCPYGSIVEMFRIRKKRNKQISCSTFGHDCPMFYNAEEITE